MSVSNIVEDKRVIVGTPIFRECKVEYTVNVNPDASEYSGGYEFHYLYRGADGGWNHLSCDALESISNQIPMDEEAIGVLRELELL
mgnify:CR=1 FL=1|jgi:hypothetical protein